MRRGRQRGGEGKRRALNSFLKKKKKKMGKNVNNRRGEKRCGRERMRMKEGEIKGKWEVEKEKDLCLSSFENTRTLVLIHHRNQLST